MKTKLLLGLAALGLASSFATSAQAGLSFNFSFGLPLPLPPPMVVRLPAPPILCPPPVCATPVVVYPAPVQVIYPHRVFLPPGRGWEHDRGYRHGWIHHGRD